MGLNLTALGVGAGAAADEMARQQVLQQTQQQIDLAANADKRQQTLADQQSMVFGQHQDSRTATIAAIKNREDALAYGKSMMPPSGYAVQPVASVPTAAGLRAQPQQPGMSMSTYAGAPVAGSTSPALTFADKAYNSNFGIGGEGDHAGQLVSSAHTPDGGVVSQFIDRDTKQPVGAPTYWTKEQFEQHTADTLAKYKAAMRAADPANSMHYDQMEWDAGIKALDRAEKKYEVDQKTGAERHGHELSYLGTKTTAEHGTTNAGIAAGATIGAAQLGLQGEKFKANTTASTATKERIVGQMNRGEQRKEDVAVAALRAVAGTYANTTGDSALDAKKGADFAFFLTDKYPDDMARISDPSTPPAERLNLIASHRHEFEIGGNRDAVGEARVLGRGRAGGNANVTNVKANTTLGEAIAPGGTGVGPYVRQAVGLADPRTVTIGGQDIPLLDAAKRPDGTVDFTKLQMLEAEYAGVQAQMPPTPTLKAAAKAPPPVVVPPLVPAARPQRVISPLSRAADEKNFRFYQRNGN